MTARGFFGSITPVRRPYSALSLASVSNAIIHLVLGAGAGVVETYHTISVEQHDVRKAPTTSSSGSEVEKLTVWQEMLKHP
jgi:hypothetical protein